MRILFGLTAVVMIACGTAPKKDSSIVQEGSDVPTQCCCKTIPATAEKEIVPNYAMDGRMECSAQQGECVDDVQCNGSLQDPDQGQPANNSDGVPPPPVLEPSTSSPGM